MGQAKSKPQQISEPEISSFAAHVVRQLYFVVLAVSREPAVKRFASKLGAELFNLTAQLASLQPGQDEDEFDEFMVLNDEYDRRLQSTDSMLLMLDDLERLCQWPSRFERPSIDSAQFDSTWYPALGRLANNEMSVENRIRHIATDPAAINFRRQIFLSLRAFNAPGFRSDMPGIHQMPRQKDRCEPSDQHAYVQALYESLSVHCLCKCQESWRQFTTNLRLNWSRDLKHANQNAMSFAMLFFDHHHYVSGATTDLCRWQDTQVLVIPEEQRLRHARKDRKHASNGHDTNVNEPNDSSTQRTMSGGSDCSGGGASQPDDNSRILNNQFCELLTRRIQAQLIFVINGGNLNYRFTTQPHRAFLTNVHSVPLRSLLSSPRLTAKWKAFLSFILVRSVWKYYDSSWMTDFWTAEKVHFMSEHDRQLSNAIYINEPFLRTQFETSHSTSSKGHDNTQSQFTTHPYPKILAIGVMLLEIELGQPIQNFRRSDTPDLNNVNALHLTAGAILQDKSIWPPPETFSDIREVIRICIHPDLAILGVNRDEVRSKFYHNVVAVLEEFFQRAWTHPDKEEPLKLQFNENKTKEAPTPSLTGSEVESNQPQVVPSQVFNAPVYYGSVHHNTATFSDGANRGSQTAFNYGEATTHITSTGGNR